MGVTGGVGPLTVLAGVLALLALAFGFLAFVMVALAYEVYEVRTPRRRLIPDLLMRASSVPLLGSLGLMVVAVFLFVVDVFGSLSALLVS